MTNRDEPTFENVILAFDNSGQMLAQTSLVFGMLCAAQNTPEMQALQEQAIAPADGPLRQDPAQRRALRAGEGVYG